MITDQSPRNAASPAYFLGRSADTWRIALQRRRPASAKM